MSDAPWVRTSAPGEYPEPTGEVRAWRLRTPSGEPVGTLRWGGGGAAWEHAATEDPDAQEHGAEVQALLRGLRAEGVDLADALAMVRAAYEGCLEEG